MSIHKASVIIHAPAQKVFEAITNPRAVKLWQYGKILTTDWQPGGEITFSVTFEGNVLEQWGTVLDMQPNKLVKYNLFTPKAGLEDKIENYNITSYILTSAGGQTKVELIQEDNSLNNFIPVSLMPILVALKKIIEPGNNATTALINCSL